MPRKTPHCITALLCIPLLAAALSGTAAAAPDRDKVLREYLAHQAQRDAVVAEVEGRFGKASSTFTDQDYARFLEDLDLARDADLWRWSHVTGIPVVVVTQSLEYFRANAHLIEDEAAAARISTDGLKKLTSTYDAKTGTVVLSDGDGRPLPIRSIGSKVIRPLALVGQVRHNPGFTEDRTVLEALGPYLARWQDIAFRAAVVDAIRSLPCSVVKVLRGKAIYLTTRGGGRTEAVWHCVGTNLDPRYAGMQPCVFVSEPADGKAADALVMGLGRIIRETVMEGQYFGLYAHPLQFPAFHELQPERRRVFGRRRDRLPRADHGYVCDRAKTDPQENFGEHFRSYIRDRESFLTRAREEESRGHPELMEKYRFMKTLVDGTSTTMERLTPRFIARVDARRQRAILDEYLVRQGRRDAVVARLLRVFGKPFREFTDADYTRFMGGLDLNDDDDLWEWSHFTGIPIAALGKRSITFHRNTHLLADAEAANLLSYAEVGKIASTYDAQTDRVKLTGADGQALSLRDLPQGVIRQTEVTDGVTHARGFVGDRLFYEALEPYLVALSDLEYREELGEGIRMLPLSIVKAYRGKAIYPTVLSRTGWAVTWRVSSDRCVSYVGMLSGSFVEPRRDPRRSTLVPSALVANGVQSLRGSAADSLVHEVGHVIDHSVIGGRPGARAFPDQFPEFQKLLDEKNRVFGEGDSRVPQTAHGYVSRYAKVNAQENFAESFWAYLRGREGFLTRARKEESEGHPGLMMQFRFMEKLIDHTPATSVRLSPEFLEKARKDEVRSEAARWGDPEEVLRDYVEARGKKTTDVAEIEKAFGKPFHRFARKDYARFMEGLDLAGDDDLRKWSHVTDIPILAVRKSSGFFYVNLHLLKDEALAERLRRTRPKAELDPESGKLVLRGEGGDLLQIRELPADIIRPTGRTGRTWYLEEFAEDRIVVEALAPYLVRVRDLDYRSAIGSWVRSLPLSVVQILRGKGLYFTTKTGRSYAVGMPCSNATYKIFVGLQTGVFVDPRRDGPSGTRHNFVHEFGHLVDYAVLLGGYGGYRHPHQFPEFRKLRPEKEIIFGRGDDKVPQTPFGYISRYSRANAQESFAEHFKAFILEREKFLELARKEAADGHPELMEKYLFMERLIESTSTSLRRLSAEFVSEEEAWTGISAHLIRLLQAGKDLGRNAPASLTRLIQNRFSAAFRGGPGKAADEKSYRKVLDAAVRDAARIRDREKADGVLAALLGVTLEVGFDRDATTKSPGMTVKIQGAQDGEVTGTVITDTLPAGRFGSVEETSINLAAGAKAKFSWRPDTGEDVAPFTARATADLRWGRRRFTLTREIIGRPSVPVWAVIGPFDNPGGAKADLKHPPETGPVDPTKTCEGQGGRTLSWQEIRRDPDAKVGAEFVVDLDRLLGKGKNAAAYLAVWVESPREAEALFSFGSADGAVVWINGERKGGWLKGRRDYASRANSLPIRLKKGRNEILVKVTVTGNGWKFAAHLTDEKGRPLPGVRYGSSR
jgi:hypothetical protein